MLRVSFVGLFVEYTIFRTCSGLERTTLISTFQCSTHAREERLHVRVSEYCTYFPTRDQTERVQGHSIVYHVMREEMRDTPLVVGRYQGKDTHSRRLACLSGRHCAVT